MKTTAKRVLGLGAVLCASTCLANPAFASFDMSAPPPDHQPIDKNGVDVTWGTFNVAEPAVAVGPAGPDGLSYQRTYVGAGWRDNVTGTLTKSPYIGHGLVVSFGAQSQTFGYSGDTLKFYPLNGDSATLTCVGSPSQCTWTASDGTQIVFDTITYPNSQFDDALGRVTSVQYPRGEILRFIYRTAQACTGCITGRRLQSVTSNLGYQLKIGYEYDADQVLTTADWARWTNMTAVTAFNMAVRYCDPNALFSDCNFLTSEHWPSATYSATATTSKTTDALSNATNYVYATGNIMTKVTSPEGPVRTVTYDYSSGSPFVQNYSDGVGTWNYGFADTGSGQTAIRTTTVTAPAVGGVSSSRVIISSPPLNGVILSEKEVTASDGSGNTTSYVYSPGLQTQLTDIVGITVTLYEIALCWRPWEVDHGSLGARCRSGRRPSPNPARQSPRSGLLRRGGLSGLSRSDRGCGPAVADRRPDLLPDAKPCPLHHGPDHARWAARGLRRGAPALCGADPRPAEGHRPPVAEPIQLHGHG